MRESETVTCEACGRVADRDAEEIALGMTDLYFCQPGYGCSEYDEAGNDRPSRRNLHWAPSY